MNEKNEPYFGPKPDGVDFVKIDKIRAEVIDGLNVVEIKISELLCDYFKPKNLDDFNNILMNNSICHYGGKLKACRALNLIDNKTGDHLLRMGSIRNTFAHSLGKGSFENKNGAINFDLKLTVINTSGKVDEKDFYDLAEEFIDRYHKIRPKLSI